MAKRFIGTFMPRLDDKGRLTLPARFRSDLEGDVVLTKGQENCIAVYTEAGFEELAARVSAAPSTETVRIMRRQLGSGADPQSVDSQGRITIAPSLRRYARLDRDCAVNGVLDHFEIWDLATWEQYDDETEPTYSKARDAGFTDLL